MAIKLTLKSDLPVPSKAMKEFANQALVKDKVEKLIAGSVSERFKRLFNKEDKKKQEELVTRLDDLAQRILRTPDGKLLWFVKWYITAFDNKVNEEAKAVFEILSEKDAFKNMEKAANDWRAKQQQRAAALSTQCSKILGPLSDDTNGVVALAKQLSALLATAIPATPPPPPKPTLAGLKEKLRGMPSLLGLLGLPADWETATDGPTLIKTIQTFREKDAASKSMADNLLQTAGFDITKPLPETLAESVKNKLKQHKSYYDLGLITENEYLAFLVETKQILSEQAAPTPEQIAQTKTWISNLTNDIHIVCEPLMAALAGLQQTTADMSKATGPVGTLSEQQEKAIKAAIKKTFLSEASKLETINEQFLLLGALVAALSAVFGWVTKKFLFPQGGTYWNGQGTVKPTQSAEQVETSVKGLTQAAGAAEGPDNKEYDISGKAVGQTAASKAAIVAALQNGQAQFTGIVNRAEGLKAPDLSLVLGIPNTNPSYAQINLLAKNLDDAMMKVPTAEITKIVSALQTGKI